MPKKYHKFAAKEKSPNYISFIIVYIDSRAILFCKENRYNLDSFFGRRLAEVSLILGTRTKGSFFVRVNLPMCVKWRETPVARGDVSATPPCFVEHIPRSTTSPNGPYGRESG